MCIEKYSKSEIPVSKRLRTDQCQNALEAQESGSDPEPESELEPESSSVRTSSTTESSSRRGRAKQKQTCNFNKIGLVGTGAQVYVQRKGMFCTLCQKYDMIPFTHGTWNKTPCTRPRVQSIISHERTVHVCKQ